MSLLKNESGFSIVEILIGVAVVVLVGFLGYTFYNQLQDRTSDSSQQNSIASDVPTAPAIETTDDLVEAENTLDSIKVESSSDSAELDSELSAF